MTIWDAMQALWRRWYVPVCAVLIGLVASHVAITTPGAYWSRAEVTFLAPTSAVNPNALRTTSSDLIIVAGVVAKRINGNLVWNQMADPATTIVGQGVLDGWSVHLPDYGGQWSRVYSRQVLDVQVSGPTADLVRERQAAIIARIDAELAGLQASVVASDRITTTVIPAAPSVYYLHGSRTRALAMIWVLCGAGVLAAVQILEQRASSTGSASRANGRARGPAARMHLARRDHRRAGGVEIPGATDGDRQLTHRGARTMELPRDSIAHP
jgi:hypothetical protein